MGYVGGEIIFTASREMRMVDDNDYRAGFEQGFRAVAGSGAGLPGLPGRPGTRAGQTPFRMGIRKGIEAGFRRKGIDLPDW